jgi:hypothetical protein
VTISGRHGAFFVSRSMDCDQGHHFFGGGVHKNEHNP